MIRQSKLHDLLTNVTRDFFESVFVLMGTTEDNRQFCALAAHKEIGK
jgi:hypothetical protein